MLESIQHIRGFCNFDHIYNALVDNAPSDETSIFVEIGSLFGRSTASMAQMIRYSGKDIQFFAIDFWDLRGISAGHWSQEDIDYFTRMGMDHTHPDVLYDTVVKTLEHFQLDEHVDMIRLDSSSAAKLFEDGSVDFLFIDGDHTYDGVGKDIRRWLPKMRPNSVIAGHDYDWSEVKRAVDELFADHEIQTSATSWLVTLEDA